MISSLQRCLIRTAEWVAEWREAGFRVMLEELRRGEVIMPVRIGTLRFSRVFSTLFALSLATVPVLCAQDSSASGAASAAPSIADAARRSREQAKSATKASKVITDDDLDKGNIKPGAQGLTVDAPATLQTQPPTAGAVAEAEVTTATPGDPAAAPAASDDPEIAHVKEMIADDEKDADLTKRDLALQQDDFLSKPDHEHDTAGKAKLDAMQADLVAKQQEIDGLKARLANLEQRKAKKSASKPAEPKPAEQPTGQQPAVTPAPAAQPPVQQ
jgi:hypothetical protein